MLVVLERKNAEDALTLIKALGRVDIYLPRPVPAEIIEEINENVEIYHMPKSTYERLSERAKDIIGDRVVIESRRGRFARVPLETVTQILALYRAGASVREIARETGIPKSTVHYILRNGVKIMDGNVKLLLQ